MYIKVAAELEQPEVLTRLKKLLLSHKGPIETALFYESTGKTIVLSSDYAITPSPKLIESVESLLGSGNAVIK
ncbi:DNA polymerase III DnaE [compost metagenome]|jgi:DNA polymerase-3 subunit alpha